MENAALPSSAQLALAMAVVKQKPTGVDIKEHILNVRNFIKNTGNSTRPSTQNKFFDSVSFWQQAFEKSEAEQSKLLDRIFELEQRNESLLAKLQTGNVPEENTRQSTKRKASTNRNAPGTATARKRAKTKAFGSKNAPADEKQGDICGLLDMIEYLEEATGPFMRQFYTLQKILQKRPNRSNIVQAAISLSKTASCELHNAVQPKKVTTRRPKTTIVLQTRNPEATKTVHNVKQAYNVLIKALGKLSGGATEVGQVTYHIVGLYDAAMKALYQHCKIKVAQPINTRGNSKLKNKQTTKSRQPTAFDTQEPLSTETDDATATQIARLLGTMAITLDLTISENQDLLEGYLFILLTRVGELLCLFVFQDLQLRPDLRLDPCQLPLPRGLIGVELDDASLLAAKMESKYLIWLLERVLASLDAYTQGDSSSQTGSFISKIKQRLQTTLLQAVFGSDSTHFQNHLRPPVQPDALELEQARVYTDIAEEATPDWFIQEVWRLLGWEMLMKHEIAKT